MTDDGAAALPGPEAAAVTFRPRTAYVGCRAFGSGDGAVLLAQGVVRRLRAAAELATGEGRVAGGLLYGRPWDDDQGSYVVVTGFLEAGPGVTPGHGRPDDGSGDFILSQADLRLLRADAARMYSASVEVGWWRTLDQLGEFSPGDFLTQRDLAGPGGAGLLVYGSGPHWGTAYLGPDGDAPDCAGTLVATRRPRVAETAPGQAAAFGPGGQELAPAADAELADLAGNESLARAGRAGAWPEPGDIASAAGAEPEDPFATATEDGLDDPFAAATGPGPEYPVPAGTGREPGKAFAIASLARERLAQQAVGAARAGRPRTDPAQANPAQTRPLPTGPPRAEQPRAALAQAGRPEAGSPEAGSREAGSRESGSPEAGSPESGSREARSLEDGSREGGSPEGGSQEEGPLEGGSLEAGQAGAAGTGPSAAGPGTAVATRRRALLTAAPRPTGPRVISPMRVSTDEWRVKRPHPANVGPETPTDVKLVVGGLIVAFIIVAVIIGMLFSNALIAVVAGVVFMLVVLGFVWMSRL